MSWRSIRTMGPLRDSLISGIISPKNRWRILIPFLNLGGIIGMQSIERLRLENQQEGIFQLKSLQYLEHQMSFFLIGLLVTLDFTTPKTFGIVIVTNL